jgi:hypothetical protein
MSVRRSMLLVVLVGFAVLVMVVLLSTRSSPARSQQGAGPGEDVAKRLMGHWTGPKVAAEANRFRSDRWDLHFKRVSGAALIGKKRHRVKGGWSKFERVDAVVDSAKHIWAVDRDGVINGSLRPSGTLELIYLEPGKVDQSAGVIQLEREN